MAEVKDLIPKIESILEELAECNNEMNSDFWHEKVYLFCQLLARLTAEMRQIESSYHDRVSPALHRRLCTLTEKIHEFSADKILGYSSLLPFEKNVMHTTTACLVEIRTIREVYKIPDPLRQHLAQLAGYLLKARRFSTYLNDRAFTILRASCIPRLQPSQDGSGSSTSFELLSSSANPAGRSMLADLCQDGYLILDWKLKLFHLDKEGYKWKNKGAGAATLLNQKGELPLFMRRLKICTDGSGSSTSSIGSRQNPDGRGKTVNDLSNSCFSYDTGTVSSAGMALPGNSSNPPRKFIYERNHRPNYNISTLSQGSAAPGPYHDSVYINVDNSAGAYAESYPQMSVTYHQNPASRVQAIQYRTVSSARMALPENSPDPQREIIDESNRYPNSNISTLSQGSAEPGPYHDSVYINVDNSAAASAESYPQMSVASRQNPAGHVGAIQDHTVSGTRMAFPENSPDPQSESIDENNHHLNYAARSQTQRSMASLNNQPGLDVANRDDETARHSKLFEILFTASLTIAYKAVEILPLILRSAGQGQAVFTIIFRILAVGFACVAVLSSLAGVRGSKFWPLHIVAVFTTAFAFIGTMFHDLLEDDPLLTWIVSGLTSALFMALMNFIGWRR